MVRNLPASAGDSEDLGSILGTGRPLGEGNGNPLLYSCLGNPIDRGVWRATDDGVAESQIRLNDGAGTREDAKDINGFKTTSAQQASQTHHHRGRTDTEARKYQRICTHSW